MIYGTLEKEQLLTIWRYQEIFLRCSAQDQPGIFGGGLLMGVGEAVHLSMYLKKLAKFQKKISPGSLCMSKTSGDMAYHSFTMRHV